MKDRFKKYFESAEADCMSNKVESFYITGKENDYRVVKTTIGVYGEYFEETGEEEIGIGAWVSVHEITGYGTQAINDIPFDFDDYEWNEYTETIMNCAPENRKAIETWIESDPSEVDTLVENLLKTLEKVA